MKKDKILLLSCSDQATEVNAIKYITYHYLQKQNAVKIFSYYETLKQLLNDKIKNYTGLSLFSTDQVELSYTYPVLDAFKDMLRKIDPNWWIDTFDRYLNQAKEYLPPAVRFIITDFNHQEALTSDLAMNYPLIRVDSKLGDKHNQYIDLDKFNSLTTKQNVHYLKMPHDQILLEKEDLDQKTLKNVELILENKILND